MTRRFEQELTHLRSNLTAMGGLVDAQLDRACLALWDGNVALAEEVVARDARIDDFDTRIDRQCQQILALSQPVAVDLRLLMAALKINSQLERIGDIAVNIAERVPPLAGHQDLLRRSRLPEMAEIARIMVQDSLESLMAGNPGLAVRVLESDDVVDNLDRAVFRNLVGEMEQDTRLVEPSAHLLILSRHLERLADHATNIAEDVIFLVEARMVKHQARTD